MMFPAHIRESDQGTEIQTAAQHSRNTATYAGSCLLDVELEQTGILMGLVHDCGKFKQEFSQYLMDPNGVRGSVNHTFAGCRLLMERYHAGQSDPMRRLAAELLAVAVGSHHGLFDCFDEEKNSGLLHRMTKEKIGYAESRRNFLEQCASEAELDSLFSAAEAELSAVCQLIASEDGEEYSFQLGLLMRLLLSGLIEGDRRDAAEFMGVRRSSYQPGNLREFWAPYLDHMEGKLLDLPGDTPICRARREISDRCRAYAEHEGGIFRLNVPTGAGKTLSALRYALAHAKKWGKRRLIFTAPLLSILDQNADVIREYLDDDSIILEHHSNVLQTEDGWELDQRELAVDSWSAPVIITTLVQLLNILFDGGSSSIRRFQALCGSVIVIDEVQTVPPKMLTLFNLALEFLAKVCRATILLCSATQPCLEKTAHPIKTDIPDIVPYNARLWKPFCRTVITDAGGKTLDEIADFAASQLEQVQSLLVVCNRRDEAEFLFTRLRPQADKAFHLSASMCTAHRRDVLARLDQALKRKQKCLCVATQVVEAGVDISFRRVIRLAAGMDNVIQAAGRCNRHGESPDPVPVYVVSCLGEDLRKLREIREAKAATESLLNSFRHHPEHFGGNLASDQAIRAYYQTLYEKMKEDYQDYPLEKPRTTLFNLLAFNEKHLDPEIACAGQFCLNQAFKLAGSRFEVFDSSTRDLVIPYEAGVQLIAELAAQKYPNPSFLADWERRARPYTIAVYDWQLQQLGNAVTEYGGIAILNEGFYDEDTGLLLRPKETEFLEV